MTLETIRVGIGVVILNDKGQILAAKRKNKHGMGTWSLAGGHLEFGESFEEGAKRETLEETGLKLQNVRFLTAASHLFENGAKHYVTIYMIGSVGVNIPQLTEPDKMEEWRFFDSIADIPQPHFVPYSDDLDQEAISASVRNSVLKN